MGGTNRASAGGWLRVWGGAPGVLGGHWPLFAGGLYPPRPSRGCGGSLWVVSKVKSLGRPPPLPRFIQLGSFSDTLLVASILEIVYDCHL